MNERPDYLDYRLDGWNLIEAAAGTGKTYTIQNLAVRFLLERRLPIRSLLVVTFTEAAAAELKERIRAVLGTMLDAATGAEPANHASANHFVKPSAEPNEVRTMPRRGIDERNSTENRRREEIFRKKCFPSSRHNQKGCFCTRLSLSLTPS